jgi:hypothetical protein
VSGRPRELARLNPRQDERCRSAIQTTQLCKRLNNFALRLPDPATGRDFEMSDTQVRAALGLLRKTLPDLASTTINGGDGDSPIHLHLIAAQFVSAQLVQDAPKPQTINHNEPLPANLLDAPPPEE